MTLARLREAMTRAKNREGIPMLVGLVDERPGSTFPAATDEAVRADGRAFATAIAEARQAMAPSVRDGDNGAVISCLVVSAHDLTPLVDPAGAEHG